MSKIVCDKAVLSFVFLFILPKPLKRYGPNPSNLMDNSKHFPVEQPNGPVIII